MSVTLREKKLKNGQVSFYLDLYHNKKRWYEFLNIYIDKGRSSSEDKEKRKLAQQIRARREHELIVDGNNLVDTTKKKICFVVFAQDYFDRRQIKSNHLGMFYHLKLFTKGRGLPFAEIDAAWIRSFQAYLLTQISYNTAARYMRMLATLLNDGLRKRIIQRNPFMDISKSERIKEKDVMRSAYTLEQLEHLQQHGAGIPLEYRQVYLFACFTGLRWSDVNGLCWQNIITRNTEKGEQLYLTFRQRKTQAVEYIPLTCGAIEILRQRQLELKNQSSPYVFAGVRDIPGSMRNYGRMRRVLWKWAKQAGMEPRKLHFHTARHSFATNILESTSGDLYTVSKLLGHRTITTTQIYAKVRDKRLLEAARSLGNITLAPLKVAGE